MRQRLLTAITLTLVVPAGFAMKYAGVPWMREHGAGALYVVFWILAAYFVWPARRTRITWIVLSVTCMLEVMQLWHPPLLEAIRATFVGRSLIGTTFDWWDFPPYFVGAAIGWLACGIISSRFPKK